MRVKLAIERTKHGGPAGGLGKVGLDGRGTEADEQEFPAFSSGAKSLLGIKKF